jgi:exopolyphosphatase/pppGpp-phosphohydrolase
MYMWLQYIVEHGGHHNRGAILRKFAGRIVHMSCQKHSSNVIEKCLIHGSRHARQRIINETLYAGGAGNADHLLVCLLSRSNYHCCFTCQQILDD